MGTEIIPRLPPVQLEDAAVLVFLHSSSFSSIPRLFQTSVLDLKEKASSLASSTLKKDNRLKSLEISLEQKKEECVKLDNKLKKVRRGRCFTFCLNEVQVV